MKKSLWDLRPRMKFQKIPEIKIEFKIKGNRGINVILSMKPTVFNNLIKKGRVNIQWEHYNLREFIKPLQCFNCWHFGHMAKYCRVKKKCSNCGSEDHKVEKCQNNVQCTNYHTHNTRFKTKFNTKHS